MQPFFGFIVVFLGKLDIWKNVKIKKKITLE